ncbi:MAG: hypothetical protein AABX30_00130 [Nanoarchaeota archaeon]
MKRILLISFAFIFIVIILNIGNASATICNGRQDATCIATETLPDGKVGVDIVTMTGNPSPCTPTTCSVKKHTGFFEITEGSFSNIHGGSLDSASTISNCDKTGLANINCGTTTQDFYCDKMAVNSKDITTLAYGFCTRGDKDAIHFEFGCRSNTQFKDVTISELGKIELDGKTENLDGTDITSNDVKNYFNIVCNKLKPPIINIINPVDDPNFLNPIGSPIDIEFTIKAPEGETIDMKSLNYRIIKADSGKVFKKEKIYPYSCYIRDCFTNVQSGGGICSCKLISETLPHGNYVLEINAKVLKGPSGKAETYFAIANSCKLIWKGDNAKFRVTFVGSDILTKEILLFHGSNIITNGFHVVEPFASYKDLFEFYYNEDFVPSSELKLSRDRTVEKGRLEIIKRGCGTNNIVFIHLDQYTGYIQEFSDISNSMLFGNIVYLGQSYIENEDGSFTVRLGTDPLIAMHEEGHAICKLDDEYVYKRHDPKFLKGINCDKSSSCNKWSKYGFPCIGTIDSNDKDGCTLSNWKRSSEDSLMKSDNPTFNTISCASCLMELEIQSDLDSAVKECECLLNPENKSESGKLIGVSSEPQASEPQCKIDPCVGLIKDKGWGECVNPLKFDTSKLGGIQCCSPGRTCCPGGTGEFGGNICCKIWDEKNPASACGKYGSMAYCKDGPCDTATKIECGSKCCDKQMQECCSYGLIKKLCQDKPNLNGDKSTCPVGTTQCGTDTPKCGGNKKLLCCNNEKYACVTILGEPGCIRKKCDKEGQKLCMGSGQHSVVTVCCDNECATYPNGWPYCV